MRLLQPSLVSVLVSLSFLACGTTVPPGPGGGPGNGSGADGGLPIADGGTTGDGGAGVDGGFTASPAALTDYSGGTCPTFTAGAMRFNAGGKDRDLIVTLPTSGTGPKGLLFLWHGLGDSAENFSSAFRVGERANTYNLVIVTPKPIQHALVGAPPTWGFIGDATPDLALFDDLRTCAVQGLGVDVRRVYTMGFSAGALWSTYLVLHRGDTLAAATIFSGGATADGQIGPRYETPAYKVPVLGTNGGPTDVFAGFVHFDVMMGYLVSHLRDDGDYVVGCSHNGGHTVPSGGTSWGYAFLAASYFGQPTSSNLLEPGTPLRASFPQICAFP